MNDILSLLYITIKFSFAKILYLCNYKNVRKGEFWLVSEKRTEARDNGIHIFRYLQNTSVKNTSYYAITKGSSDYIIVNEVGNVAEFDSVFHILLYIGAKYYLFGQVDSKPYENSRGISRMDQFVRDDQVRVYLTHGICKDDIPEAYDFRIANYDIFICGAKPEYDYYKKIYNYPDNHIKYTGLCRYDALSDTSFSSDILIMPTYRQWLRTTDSAKQNASQEETRLFEQSDFFKFYTSLLTNKRLLEALAKFDIRIKFYLHYTLQPYTQSFVSRITNSNVIICNRNNSDVQQLLKENRLLITDYSSVAFDFSYMKKPIVYYHFDYERYREAQYKEGYYKYSENGLGPVFVSEKELVEWILLKLENMSIDDLYLKRINNFFEYNDSNNCLRVYKCVKNYIK